MPDPEEAAARAPGTSPRLAEIRPRGPYSMALSARLSSDPTRRLREGVLTSAVRGDDGFEVTRAWQRPDGRVVIHARTDGGVDATRFVLALDDDPSEFLRRFADDSLVGGSIRELRGLRVTRVPTVAGALLRALCGQLIDSRTARRIERAVISSTSERVGDLFAPPTSASLAVLAPARLRALGLHARRGATLVRLCGSLELERLRTVPVEAAAARLRRERGLGRWSVGVVGLYGLGSYRFGLAGDLGMLKLFRALHGRWPEDGEDAELLAPFGEWQGLASVYLLAGFARGLIPVSHRTAA